MQVINRIENKLLNRVEIEFKWSHPGAKTPSRKEIIDTVRTLEPGANPDLVVVKNTTSRYGQSVTTGFAFIYSSEEAMAVEPAYIHKRHESLRSNAGASDDGGEA